MDCCNSGELSDEMNARSISAALEASGRSSLEDTLTEASSMLSGLSAAAGLVLAPKLEGALRHIEDSMPLGPGRALTVLVAADAACGEPGDRNAVSWPAAVGFATGGELSEQLARRPRWLAELRVTVAEELAANRTRTG